MINDTSSTGGIQQLEDHYNTFITEQDIAEIAGAGLNFVRVPIPFWAVDVWDTRMFGQTVPGVPRLLKTLRNPISSGAVSCVAAFPDGRHIAV